jgi:hypothetical protein
VNEPPLIKQQKGDRHLIKGYGNAIVPQVAAVFIRAFLELEKEK